MPVITESNNLGDLLKYEAPNRYSREVATIAAGQNLPLGTVLGRNASDGKHYAIDPEVLTVQLPGGGVVRARGSADAGQRVFVRDGVVQAIAPSLTLEIIDI